MRGGANTLALLLAVALTALWTALAWTDLAALRLPEPDDMVRLAQIRDWLDGQSFSDLVQARLGPPGGTPLHWSRLPDLVPALIIWLLSPLMGVARTEIAAVIFWPELLFFLHLLLIGGLARRLGEGRSAALALAIGAFAFPAIALFAPGRIDHHGLQLVLSEAMLLALLSSRLLLAGAVAGVSLAVGAEATPVIATAMLWLALGWVSDRRAVAGFGFGLLIASLSALALLRPQIWPGEFCDSFTPPAFTLMLMASGYWLVLGGLAPRLPDVRWRAGVALLLGALVLAAGWLAAPACFGSPYGAADPLLQRVWPEQVGEYGGLLRQSPAMLIAWLGLPLIGLGAGLWLSWRRTSAAMLLLTGVLIVSILASFLQLRTLWFAAALAAPLLAQAIIAIRIRALQVLAAIASVGLVWQGLGLLAPPRAVAAETCTDRHTLLALDRLDTGTFAAPMSLSGYLIGATQHRSLGGPFHRDRAGNRALAELFLSSPEEARYVANLWTVDYVALCPSATGGLPPPLLRPSGLAAHLLSGAAPDWLDPVPLVGSNLLVWRVRAIAGPGLRP
ncbi:hypothetical protein HJG53_15135 [Sphingomonas sp. ID1715]|uniref:hypothetical protein n=1 Tax=Sphingomonas sp. ID1715 TaxID=1656898 RepID=UPI00148A03DC|nr:hypothetical protein [Sphingomonas sp. ID1715]NNM78225.1 hypothetical protein [Sphingomonas sp. ID1715]